MKTKTNRGFVYEELIKWVAIGAIVLLGGWGLFKYQSGLYEKISTLETNQKTLQGTIAEKDKEIDFLKELKKSDENAVEKLDEERKDVETKVKVLKGDKAAKIDTIKADPILTPLEKSNLISEVQISTIWMAFCQLSGETNPDCPIDTEDKDKPDTPEDKK